MSLVYRDSDVDLREDLAGLPVETALLEAVSQRPERRDYRGGLDVLEEPLTR